MSASAAIPGTSLADAQRMLRTLDAAHLDRSAPWLRDWVRMQEARQIEAGQEQFERVMGLRPEVG